MILIKCRFCLTLKISKSFRKYRIPLLSCSHCFSIKWLYYWVYRFWSYQDTRIKDIKKINNWYFWIIFSFYSGVINNLLRISMQQIMFNLNNEVAIIVLQNVLVIIRSDYRPLCFRFYRSKSCEEAMESRTAYITSRFTFTSLNCIYSLFITSDININFVSNRNLRSLNKQKCTVVKL